MYNALLLSAGGGIISQNSVSKQIGSACVMIGIGGTGLAALRRVKKEVYQHLEPDDPSASVPKYSRIAFLGIDTDTNDLTIPNPDITDLQADEQWSVNLPNLGTMLASNQVREDPRFKWLSTGISMTGNKGAGGNRQAGRFCLFQRAASLRAKIHELVTSVMQAAESSSVQVHIFAGLSGGTGSGCFLDVCYVVRDILESIDSTVCGYFFLPDTQLFRTGIMGVAAIENYNKRNGYAALRDLDYCMSIPSSGGCFKEDYDTGFSVESHSAPVDLCHLISATDTKGVIKSDGFNYSLSVVAEYVLTYLSDINVSDAEKRNDDKGLTIEGFTININQALGTIKPRYGAERKYNIVGASSAELPLTHIGTYLASMTYQKMKPSLGQHSSKFICDEFARKIGCTTEGLVKELSASVSTVIPFNPDPERLDGLNEDIQSYGKVPESLHGPINACLTTAIGKIQANFTAQSKELESYDAKFNAQVEQPTFILRLFNELVRVCMDAQKGPTMAADLLHGAGIADLQSVLHGIAADIAAKEENFKANEQLRIQDITNAAHSYNNAVVGWKSKLRNYQDAWTNYVRLQINLELCAKLKNLIPILEKNLEAMYRNYFAPLRDMIVELGQTFEANISWLAAPQHKEDSFCWRIFEYDDVKDELDSNVLKQQDMSLELKNFMDYLLAHYQEWNNRNIYRTAHCVNTYMVERFKETLNQTVDSFLLAAYHLTDPRQLPARIQATLLNSVSLKASPLFWTSPTFQISNVTTVSNNVLSIPMGSTAIDEAAENFSQTTSNVIVRHSALGDRVSCLRFVSGIPLYAYQGVESLKGPYESSNDKGLHLHERDENWREILPSPIPYSISVIEKQATEKEKKIAALYDEAVKERVICPKSPKFPDDYVVRIIKSTEKLVEGYWREKYFFAGKLNYAELEKDISILKNEREKLLPETVPHDEGLVLLNDGYRAVNNPELDATETVRRDYFIRFNGLRVAAEESLANLKRIDKKLAEMEGWKGEQSEQIRKIKRYLMLDEMGYIVRESNVKAQLCFTYRGVPMHIQVCDVNSDYKFASEYQIFRNLDTLDPKQMEVLGAELETKHLNPEESWRKPLQKIVETFTDEKIESIHVRYQNDLNGDAIPAFYRSLREEAKEELMLLPEDPTQPKVEEASVEKPASEWTCASCGALNPADEKFCGECGASQPPEHPDTWTCPKCGKIVAWSKKFCGSCGTRRPDLVAPPKDWKCPSCGTVNEASEKFCGECGEPRP